MGASYAVVTDKALNNIYLLNLGIRIIFYHIYYQITLLIGS